MWGAHISPDSTGLNPSCSMSPFGSSVIFSLFWFSFVFQLANCRVPKVCFLILSRLSFTPVHIRFCKAKIFLALNAANISWVWFRTLFVFDMMKDHPVDRWALFSLCLTVIRPSVSRYFAAVLPNRPSFVLWHLSWKLLFLWHFPTHPSHRQLATLIEFLSPELISLSPVLLSSTYYNTMEHSYLLSFYTLTVICCLKAEQSSWF